MSESKETRKKSKPAEPQTSEKKTSENPPPSEPKTTYILATGLEDYGRWKSMFNEHKREPNEKPFRRGRIWC